MGVGGEPVRHKGALGQVDGRLRDIDCGDVHGPTESRGHRESARIPVQVEHALATRERTHPSTRLAMIEKEAGLLAFPQIAEQRHAPLADRDLARRRLAEKQLYVAPL